MTPVVLDTHVALWWSFFPEKLSEAATGALSEAGLLIVPAIVFWETALLVRKGRLDLGISPAAWLAGIRATARVKIASLTAEIGLLADELVMHDDPADRFIVATALRRSAPLVTRDALIRSAHVVRTIW